MGCSRPYDESSNIPITGWVAVLKLSTLWNAPALRKAAIESIDNELETWEKKDSNAEEIPAVLLPINLVLLGKEYSVDRWTLHGYRSLINRKKRISELDAWQTLGWKQAFQVMLLRETRSKRYPWRDAAAAESRIREIFQCAIPEPTSIREQGSSQPVRTSKRKRVV